MPSTLNYPPGHILAAGDTKSTDLDKFGPKNALIQPSGQILKSRGWARSNPDTNDQMHPDKNPRFRDQAFADINGGPTFAYGR